MSMDVMQELPTTDQQSLIIANGLVTYSYTESVCIDEVDNSLCKHIKEATLSGQYPLLKSVVDILERLGMRDKDPILRYNQVREKNNFCPEALNSIVAVPTTL